MCYFFILHGFLKKKYDIGFFVFLIAILFTMSKEFIKCFNKLAFPWCFTKFFSFQITTRTLWYCIWKNRFLLSKCTRCKTGHLTTLDTCITNEFILHINTKRITLKGYSLLARLKNTITTSLSHYQFVDFST